LGGPPPKTSALAVDSILTMEDRVAGSLAEPRLYAVLLGGFAFFALIVAAIGLFSVLSYNVVQRSPELALRVALGANRSNLLRLVVGQGMSITIIGLVVGIAIALGSVRFLSSFLYGMTTYDAATFIAAPTIVIIVAASACILPAVRAT